MAMQPVRKHLTNVIKALVRNRYNFVVIMTTVHIDEILFFRHSQLYYSNR